MTSPGRPPTWLLDPATPSPVAQDVAEFDHEGRLVIPARLRHGLDWLPGDVLGVLGEPGCARLLRWNDWAPRVLKKRNELLGRLADIAAPTRDDLELVRALDDRYYRLKVQDDGRVRLPEPLRLHLSRDLHEVVTVRFPSELELWAPGYRSERNRRAAILLDDLP